MKKKVMFDYKRLHGRLQRRKCNVKKVMKLHPMVQQVLRGKDQRLLRKKKYVGPGVSSKKCARVENGLSQYTSINHEPEMSVSCCCIYTSRLRLNTMSLLSDTPGGKVNVLYQLTNLASLPKFGPLENLVPSKIWERLR